MLRLPAASELVTLPNKVLGLSCGTAPAGWKQAPFSLACLWEGAFDSTGEAAAQHSPQGLPARKLVRLIRGCDKSWFPWSTLGLRRAGKKC